jgi:hypothetical protein
LQINWLAGKTGGQRKIFRMKYICLCKKISTFWDIPNRHFSRSHCQKEISQKWVLKHAFLAFILLFITVTTKSKKKCRIFYNLAEFFINLQTIRSGTWQQCRTPRVVRVVNRCCQYILVFDGYSIIL